MNKRRMNIGLFINQLENDFAGEVTKGAMMAAHELDVNLIVFPGRYINPPYQVSGRESYEYQYNTVFEYASNKNIDVLLVLMGSIGCSMNMEEQQAFLKRFKEIPVIVITSEVEGYPSVLFDNKIGMMQEITHLIQQHNCRKIGFVSGPITNHDAVERLEAYKTSLLENGLEVDEDKIVYGRFVKYCHPEVEELLDRNPDLDAIVFANDEMAEGGYEVLEQRGITVGVDIAVVGFDNSNIATQLTPNLTTVKADASELGYQALQEACQYAYTGNAKNITVDSYMVTRRSCGCRDYDIHVIDRLVPQGLITNESRFDVMCGVTQYVFGRYLHYSLSQGAIEFFKKCVAKILECILNDELSSNIGYIIVAYFDSMIQENALQYTTIERIIVAFDYLQDKALKQFKNCKAKLQLAKAFQIIYKHVIADNWAMSKAQFEDINNLTEMTSCIARDMLHFKDSSDESYGTVVDKLEQLQLGSSYLYLFENPIIHRTTDALKMPKDVLLKAYHRNHTITVLPKEKQKMRSYKALSNDYLPKDKQYCAVIAPIYMNEEQYGFVVCELEKRYFQYISSITFQICAAVKFLRLLKQQEEMQKQLEDSLIQIRENNDELQEISKSDELTGIYNRRGFMEHAMHMLTANNNVGKNAMVVYADMDNLKVVNDQFGHDNGDFALKTIAKMLLNIFSKNAIIGRLGGDEFAVATIVDEQIDEEQIRERANRVIEEMNCISGKPYYIRMSAGIVRTLCSKTIQLSPLLEEADNKLYAAKKNKEKKILK